LNKAAQRKKMYEDASNARKDAANARKAKQLESVRGIEGSDKSLESTKDESTKLQSKFPASKPLAEPVFVRKGPETPRSQHFRMVNDRLRAGTKSQPRASLESVTGSVLQNLVAPRAPPTRM
jgi:hypothetical protein